MTATTPGRPLRVAIVNDYEIVVHGVAQMLTAHAAQVEVVEPTGSETMVVLRLGSKEITARYEPIDAPRVGDAAELMVDMTKASLFDPVTEARL